MIFGHYIPEEYLPDRDSFYVDVMPENYQKYFTSLNNDEYVEKLKLNSFELIIRPNNSYYRDTISAEDAGEFLTNISKSFLNYSAIEFYKKYKNEITNPDTLSKATKTIIKETAPRITDAKQHSFSVSLSTDFDMSRENNDFLEYKKNVSRNYATQILQLDLNSNEDINFITEKYDEYSRKQIFDPLIKIINNNNYDLTYINKKENFSKPFEKINPLNKAKVIVKRPKEPLPEIKKVWATITLELQEGADLLSIGKRDIQQMLFAKISQDAPYEIEKILTEKYLVIFTEPIVINYHLYNSICLINFLIWL